MIVSNILTVMDSAESDQQPEGEFLLGTRKTVEEKPRKGKPCQKAVSRRRGTSQAAQISTLPVPGTRLQPSSRASLLVKFVSCRDLAQISSDLPLPPLLLLASSSSPALHLGN